MLICVCVVFVDTLMRYRGSITDKKQKHQHLEIQIVDFAGQEGQTAGLMNKLLSVQKGQSLSGTIRFFAR